MKKINCVISLIILTCFLLNSTVYGVAITHLDTANDTLAAPSRLDDLTGIEHNDIGKIKFALETFLKDAVGSVNFIDESMIRGLTMASLSEKTVFHPANMQFFFSEKETLPNGLIVVMCRLWDQYSKNPRTYYAAFSTKEGRYKGFPIEVYTAREYKGLKDSIKEDTHLPLRKSEKPEDAKAIDRYVQHEKGIDAVIRYAHEHGLAKKPVGSKFSYEAKIQQLLEDLDVKVANPEGLMPIEEKDFFLIKLTDEIKKMIEELPKARVIDINGKEHEVSYLEHSSNNAVHVFVDEEKFDFLTTRTPATRGMVKIGEVVKPVMQGLIATADVQYKLVHAIGVMLGMPVLRVEQKNDVNQAKNKLDDRYAILVERGDKAEFATLEAEIANLDTNLLTRDYAAGEELVDNPFLTNMLARLRRVAEILKLNEENKAIIFNPENIYTSTLKTKLDDGREEEIYTVRVKDLLHLGKNEKAVLAKGGIRYILPKNLGEEFYKKLDEWNKQGFDINEIRARVKKWIVEETRALAAGMTLKNALVGLPLGGGKGTVTLFKIEMEKGKAIVKPLKEGDFSETEIAYITRTVSRDWMEQGIVGPDLDIPAPDINTTRLMGLFMDELIEVLLEDKNSELWKELPELARILEEEVDDNLIEPRYLERTIRYLQGRKGRAFFPWIGTYTGKPVPLGGSLVREEATALGTLMVGEEAAKKVFNAWSLEGLRVAIQGFGNAGQHAARLFSKEGAKIVAVSDSRGGIYKENGFSIEELGKLHRLKEKTEIVDGKEQRKSVIEYKDEGITDVKVITNAELLELDVDILIPAALEDVITKENAANIRAKLILEAANGPVTVGADEILHEKEITVVSDSLASAGGVIVSYFEMLQNIFNRYFSEREIKRKLKKALVKNFNRIWDVHNEFGVDLRTAGDILSISRVLGKKVRNPILDEMISLAHDAGLQIPTHPDQRYTLLVDYSLHREDAELERDIKGHVLQDGRHIGAGDRFNLERVDTSSMDNILKHVQDPKRTIVQISNRLRPEDVLRLMKDAPGIRIMNVDTQGFKYDKSLDDTARQKYRFDLYAMMLAARRITKEDIKENNSVYRTLAFFLNTHYKDGEEDIAPRYIDALVNDDIRDNVFYILQHILSYKPAQRWQVPNYELIAATLISV